MVVALAALLSRRNVAALTVVVSLLVLAWALFADSDEAKIRSRLEELARAVATANNENAAFRALRLKGVFEKGLEPGAALRAPELPETHGVKELTVLAASVPSYYGELGVSIGETDVRIDRDAHEAHVVASVTISGTTSGELRRDKRVVRFTPVERDGEWRVVFIEVEPKTHEQPEARP